MSEGSPVEEYLNLYRQKLWEIAYENLIRTFFYPTTILLFVLFLIFWCIFFRKKWIILFISSYFFLFLFAIAAEYVNSYDKIMNSDSLYNSYFVGLLKRETVLPMLKKVDEIPLASVDGKLERKNIILFALSNPMYYGGLFNDTADFFTGGHIVGKLFLVALVGYEEKDGQWQSVDIRTAPGEEEKDFQKFSKVLHITRDGKEGETTIILELQKFYELKLRKEKN